MGWWGTPPPFGAVSGRPVSPRLPAGLSTGPASCGRTSPTSWPPAPTAPPSTCSPWPSPPAAPSRAARPLPPRDPSHPHTPHPPPAAPTAPSPPAPPRPPAPAAAEGLAPGPTGRSGARSGPGAGWLRGESGARSSRLPPASRSARGSAAEPLRAAGSSTRGPAAGTGSAHRHGESSGGAVAGPRLASFTSLPGSDRGWSPVGPSLHPQLVAVSGRGFHNTAPACPAGDQPFNANGDGVGRSTGSRKHQRGGRASLDIQECSPASLLPSCPTGCFSPLSAFGSRTSHAHSCSLPSMVSRHPHLTGGISPRGEEEEAGPRAPQGVSCRDEALAGQA